MLLVLPLLVAADKMPVVKKLLRPMITLYDEQGVSRGREPQWPLPPGGAPIVGHNANGQVGIWRVANGNRELVYLRNSEIETENEQGPCLATTSAGQDPNRHVAASSGVHSGVSGSNAACIASGDDR